MCDTLCSLGRSGAVFAKSSDRPPGEVQLVAAHGRRSPGGRLRTQYLEILDEGAAATVLACPTWLWGAEHGINEHRVAIGNEKIYTTADLSTAPDALIGMDLVRLGLERSRTADEALEVVTALLAAHGQGGVGDAAHGDAYCSSFLVADPRAAWVLETAGRTWAARPVDGTAAISNRICLRTDWTLGSADLAVGEDFDHWRDPRQLTGDADLRLAAGRALLAGGPDAVTPRRMVAHLRDHGGGPWGAPGAGEPPWSPPADVLADFTGISVCLHVRGYVATTSSMVAELPADPATPQRAWVATGSPCVSVYVPAFPVEGERPGAVPRALADEQLWHDFERLREQVERDPERIDEVRRVLDPIEAELWEEADALVESPDRWPPAAQAWGRRVSEAAAALAGER